MPLADAGFVDNAGRPDQISLIRFGPSIEVVVSALPDGDRFPSEGRTTHALIDTGATRSCIDTELARSLGLLVVDVVTISGAAGPREHDVYAAHVAIPGLEMARYGPFAGVDLKAGGQPHKVLLGRTFLHGTMMIYDGIRGQVTIASTRLTD